jgi:hypothetical protein
VIKPTIVLVALLFCSRATAQEQPASTSGLALGAGVGFDNAGVGGHALYYLQTRSPRWRVAPHVGVGYFGRAAVSGGVLTAFGLQHRLVIDLLATPVAGEGETGKKMTVYYGMALLLGWEWYSATGVGIRLTIGPSLDPTPHAPDVLFGGDLSLLYKLW